MIKRVIAASLAIISTVVHGEKLLVTDNTQIFAAFGQATGTRRSSVSAASRRKRFNHHHKEGTP